MSDIQNKYNPHLIYWSSFLALIESRKWQSSTPPNRALFHLNMLRRFSVGTPGGDKPVFPRVPPQDFAVKHFTGMVAAAKEADPDINYTTEDLDWMLDVITKRDVLVLTFMWACSVTMNGEMTNDQ